MICKDENKLHKMLYLKANHTIYWLQQYEQGKIDIDSCLKNIKEEYQDTPFLELLQQKNEEMNKNLEELKNPLYL